MLTVCVHTHVYNDPFVQQTLLLCRHDKVVCVVFVVNYVLQVNSWKHEQIYLKSTQSAARRSNEKQTDSIAWYTTQTEYVLFLGKRRLCSLGCQHHIFSNAPVSSLSSRKNFWLKMKATPLISSTLASAVVFLLTKLAVMAMANFPRNSLQTKPAEGRKNVAMNHAEGNLRWKVFH